MKTLSSSVLQNPSTKYITKRSSRKLTDRARNATTTTMQMVTQPRHDVSNKVTWTTWRTIWCTKGAPCVSCGPSYRPSERVASWVISVTTIGNIKRLVTWSLNHNLSFFFVVRCYQQNAHLSIISMLHRSRQEDYQVFEMAFHGLSLKSLSKIP